MINTNDAAIDRMVASAPFADNQVGIPEMVEMIKTLQDQRKSCEEKFNQIIAEARSYGMPQMAMGAIVCRDFMKEFMK